VIESLTILDPQRERQTRRKIQPGGALPSLPIHEREQGEPEDVCVRKDDEDCHCIIERMKWKEGSAREWLAKGRIWGSEKIVKCRKSKHDIRGGGNGGVTNSIDSFQGVCARCVTQPGASAE
jgi:hypothetical protein